jgi:hypothetical protein
MNLITSHVEYSLEENTKSPTSEARDKVIQYNICYMITLTSISAIGGFLFGY